MFENIPFIFGKLLWLDCWITLCNVVYIMSRYICASWNKSDMSPIIELCLCFFSSDIVWYSYDSKVINSLRPVDAIWQHRSGSTLAQVMACCLTAPSHYLNQCWFIISKQGVQWSGKSQGNSRLGKSQGKVKEFCWRSGKKMNIRKSQGKVREFAFSAI